MIRSVRRQRSKMVDMNKSGSCVAVDQCGVNLLQSSVALLVGASRVSETGKAPTPESRWYGTHESEGVVENLIVIQTWILSPASP